MPPSRSRRTATGLEAAGGVVAASGPDGAVAGVLWRKTAKDVVVKDSTWWRKNRTGNSGSGSHARNSGRGCPGGWRRRAGSLIALTRAVTVCGTSRDWS